MINIIIYIAVVIISFAAMEGVAWLAHKYLMHGLLWVLHRDHHKKDEYGFFEHNDFFFLIFATPGILCLAFGTYSSSVYLLAIGVGISLYGFCYFLVHDVFIHQRIKVFRNSNNRYLRGIRRAHKMHHKHLGKEHGECFGMLWVPLKY
ncbi:MAG: beta-carotene hydroxylase, partial [Mucilaginibacter sp.]